MQKQKQLGEDMIVNDCGGVEELAYYAAEMFILD